METNYSSMETSFCSSQVAPSTQKAKDITAVELGFLCTCWEAIKNFFSWLLQSLCWCYSRVRNFFIPQAPIPTPSSEITPLQYLMKLRETQKPRSEITDSEPSNVLEIYLESASISTEVSIDPNKLVPQQIRDAKETFQQKLQHLMLPILQGKSDTLTISNDAQLLKLIDFAKQKLKSFNDSLQIAVQGYNSANASGTMRLPFNPLEELQGLKELETIATNWKGLTKFENKEYLDEFDLNSLRNILNGIPVNTAYTSLNQKIYKQLIEIANRPVFARYTAFFNEVFGSFTAKFHFPPIHRVTLELWLKNGHNACVAKLEEEMRQTLARYEKTLTLKDVEEILAKVQYELGQDHTRLKAQAEAWQTGENPEFDPGDDYRYAFADLERLLDIWKQMQGLTSNELGMDDKIEALGNIAERLSDDHAIYDKYPIKEAMEASLEQLHGAFFARRELTIVSEEDKVRKECIMSGINAVAQKLGSKTPMTEDMVMNQDDDELLLTSEGETEMRNAAEQIQTLYHQEEFNNPTTAARDAAIFLRSYVTAFKDPKEQQKMFVLVYHNLDSEIANLLKPYVSDLFPPLTQWEKLKKIVQSRILNSN